MMRGVTMALAGLALVAGLSTTALAQGGGEGRPRGGMRGGMGQMMNPERMREAMFRGIELSPEQQARVKAISEQYQPRLTEARQQMMAARQSGQQVSPALMQQMRRLNTEQRDSLRAVLTDAQKPVFDRNIEELQPRRRPPGQGRARLQPRSGR